MATTFDVNPNSVGSVFLTDFTFTSNVSSATSFAWDFGDETVSYEGPLTSHIYQYPGTYTVSGSAWTNDGSSAFVSTQAITVDYVCSNKVEFTQIPKHYSDPGLPTATPFVVSLTCTEIQDSLYLVMQSLNTNSTPIAYVPDKWNFITPKWKFVDATTNQVVTDGLLVNTSPIYQTYNGEQRVVAVSGTASFYYVDDLPTRFDSANSSPILLVATLSTQKFVYPLDSQIYSYDSYANSDLSKAAALWQINDYFPTNLKVTENFISDVYPIKWSGVPIPTMITCQFDSALNPNFVYATPLTANLIGYPRTNDIGSLYPITLELSDGSPSSLERDSLYFSNTDELENTDSGYVFTSITPLLSSFNSITLVASTTCVEPLAAPDEYSFVFPNGYPIYSDAFVFQPYLSNLNKLSLVNCPSANSFINYYKNLNVLTDGKLDVLNLPVLSSVETPTVQSLSSAPVYGVTIDPILNVTYACDPINNNIYTIDNTTNSVGPARDLTYSLSRDETEAVYPCCMSVDGNHNIWVSLYNEETIVKLDSLLNFICYAEPLSSTYIEEVQHLAPPIVETNMANEVWACYAQYNAGYVVKFDTNGNHLRTVSLSSSSPTILPVPVSLAIDKHNTVWVACYNTNTILNLRDSDGHIDLILNADRPNHLAVDRSNNIWFTCGYNFIGRYNPNTYTLTTWQISTLDKTSTLIEDVIYTPSTVGFTSEDGIQFITENGYVVFVNEQEVPPILPNLISENNILFITEDGIDITIERASIAYNSPSSVPYKNEMWGGLSVDVYDRVWAIDSKTNSVIVFSTQDPTNLRVINTQPSLSTVDIRLSTPLNGVDIPTSHIHSSQAVGDWTGNKWYQKYATAINTTPVVGTSTPFTVSNLNGSYGVAKVNEEFDISAYFQSLALPESLSRNTKFFQEFLAAVAGDGNPTNESAGRVIYERIANFVQTHGDFETSEIDQLVSYATQLSVDVKTYGIDFPAEINRLLSLFSVPKNSLRGRINYDPDVNNNIGVILTETDMVSAGQQLFAQDKRYGNYSIVYVTALDYNIEDVPPPSAIVYPLASLNIAGFRTPLTENYYFFQYVQNNLGYTENIINWDSMFTTFDYSLSTNEEWYGDNGLIETMFNNVLTKRLTE